MGGRPPHDGSVPTAAHCSLQPANNMPFVLCSAAGVAARTIRRSTVCMQPVHAMHGPGRPPGHGAGARSTWCRGAQHMVQGRAAHAAPCSGCTEHVGARLSKTCRPHSLSYSLSYSLSDALRVSAQHMPCCAATPAGLVVWCTAIKRCWNYVCAKPQTHSSLSLYYCNNALWCQHTLELQQAYTVHAITPPHPPTGTPPRPVTNPHTERLPSLSCGPNHLHHQYQPRCRSLVLQWHPQDWAEQCFTIT
jgi:hypothetical protein